jgi:RHS repeat-associated protein
MSAVFREGKARSMPRRVAKALLLLVAALAAAVVQAQTTVEYIHTDALGSVVAVTNQAGQVIERNDYEPYGGIIGKPSYGGVGFTGHVQDAATGLTYMQQRYYDPEVGVFLSVDPIVALSAPVLQFHRYRYANSNPYKFVDPDGRASDKPERQPRDTSSLTSRPSIASRVSTVQISTGGRSGRQQGNASIRYNAPSPQTVPPSGENAMALQCTANCVSADGLLVTGGAEQSGHSRNSLHYKDKAVDIAGPPFNNVQHGEIMRCAKACGYTHGGWEVNGRFYADGNERSSIYKDHWHFQIGGSGRVPPLPGIGFEMTRDVPASPIMKGGMIGP